ncbi:uncharacterized protein EV420DRAFT_1278574, partial [Desarmillaria tabescens]
TNEAKGKMPLWYHSATSKKTNRINNSLQAKCLRNNHQIHLVGDAMNTIENQPNSHKKSNNKCKCNKCKQDRLKGCINSAKCLATIKKLLNDLPAHWNPQNKNRQQIKIDSNENTQDENSNTIKIFKHELPTSNNIYDTLRIFTTAEDNLSETCKTNQTKDNIITVYTDGGCQLNDDINAQAGSGIWFNKDNNMNIACRVPGLNQSNQTGELYAVEYTACKTSKIHQLKIGTDSKYTINTITNSLSYFEDKGWVGVENAYEIKRVVAWL